VASRSTRWYGSLLLTATWKATPYSFPAPPGPQRLFPQASTLARSCECSTVVVSIQAGSGAIGHAGMILAPSLNVKLFSMSALARGPTQLEIEESLHGSRS
jgi:hypothetical protein